MAREEGLIIQFSSFRRIELLRNIESEDNYPTFSDALHISNWNHNDKEVALLSLSDTTLDYICIATKKNNVVTGKARFVFSDFVSLQGLTWGKVGKIINFLISENIASASKAYGKKLTFDQLQILISAIKELKPSLIDEIDRLLMIKKMSDYTITGSNTKLLIQEREALGISLDIFDSGTDLRKSVLGGWSPNINNVVFKETGKKEATLKESTTDCFLTGISQRFIQEETAIQHDLCNWSGLAVENVGGVAKFTKGGRTLDVIYANRNSLEKTTGVDLIYYNRRYNSFVLVQYKLMKSEGSEPLYRPDEQLLKELERMDNFVSSYSKGTDNFFKNDSEYRLNYDGFTIKLVPNKGLFPASHELIRGMYITREYMHYLLSENGPTGKLGGKVINFENSPRYLTNSDFTNFVSRGWLGTNGLQSSSLKNLITSYLETGNAVLLAVEDLQRIKNS